MNGGLPLSILDMLPFGVLWTDADLRVRALNQWLRSYLEGRAETLVGTPLLQAFPEIGEAGRLMAFRLVLQSGQPVLLSAHLHRYLIRLPSFPGSAEECMPQMVHLLPDLDERGGVAGVIALIYDQSERLRGEQALRRELQKVQVLQEIDHALTTLQLDDCLNIIAERVQRLLEADQAVVLLRRGDELEVAARAGMEHTPPRARFSVHTGISGWVARTGVPVVVDDVRRDSRYLPTDPSLRSAIAVPLTFRGRVNGVIDAESRKPAAFNLAHLDMLETLASRASIAIQNAMLYRATDERRAYFEAVLDHTGDVIFTLDTNLRITTVNAAWDDFARANGAPELAGRGALGRDVLRSMTADARAHWEPVALRLLRGELEEYTEDIPCHTPEKERWLNLRMAPMRDHRGKIIGLVCSTRDITARILAERRLRRSNDQLHVLLEAMRLMSTQLSPRALMDSTVNFLSRTFEVPAAAFYAWDEARQDFSVAAGKGLDSALLSLRLPALETVQTDAIQHMGVVSYIPNMRRWARAAGLEGLMTLRSSGRPSSAMLARVFTRRRFAGLLAVFAVDAPRAFTTEERELLEAVAAQFGVALENANAFAEQQELATTDALTGLANRRQFNTRLEEETSRAARYQEPVALVMVDIDDFKSFNDTFGHPAGDEVLKALAVVMRGNLRRVDMLARYGGEEFAIILPHAEVGDAFRVAERVRAAVERQMQAILADICAAAAPDRPPRPTITISMGVAAAPRHALRAEKLLAAADIALYEAKRLGKNRVCIYQGGAPAPQERPS